MPKRQIIIIAVFVLGGVIFIAGLGSFKVLEYLQRKKCEQHLRSIGAVVEVYRQLHQNQIPPAIDDLEKEVGSSLEELFQCPVAQQHHTPSYIYVDWATAATRPKWKTGKYPLAYDASFSNRSGKGINVLMVDGTVECHVESKWLSQVAREHPDVRIV